jgi:hypothetical protein
VELGTAILVSAVLISAVLLYGFTKDKVRWGRVFKRTGISILSVAVLGGAAIYTWSLWSNRPVVVSQLDGVTLGELSKEVIFRKGKPSLTCWTKDKKSRTFHYSKYFDESFRTIEIDENDRVVRLQATDRSFYFPEARVSSYDTSETIIEKWGEPTDILEESPSRRYYIFKRYNVGFFLENNKAKTVVVFDGNNEFYRSEYFSDASVSPNIKIFADCDAGSEKTEGDDR